MRYLGFFLLFIVFSFGFSSDSFPVKGEKVIDIVLTNPKGKKVKLSKLKGKMVLIDFWASWCRPCRMENPNVVEAYKKYRKVKFKEGNGFEVFSISLDRNKEKWKEAIEKDGLIWKYHGFDDGGKTASAFGVRSIPSAFLINGKGEIMASGNEIRGLNLHLVLDDLRK